MILAQHLCTLLRDIDGRIVSIFYWRMELFHVLLLEDMGIITIPSIFLYLVHCVSEVAVLIWVIWVLIADFQAAHLYTLRLVVDAWIVLGNCSCGEQIGFREIHLGEHCHPLDFFFFFQISTYLLIIMLCSSRDLKELYLTIFMLHNDKSLMKTFNLHLGAVA